MVKLSSFASFRRTSVFLAMLAAACLTAAAQTKTVRGTVTDEEFGDPLMGATIKAVGSGEGTTTDLDGNFTLTLPASVSQVVVSYVGYVSQTLPVSSTMKIRLSTNQEVLDDVVVIGYGTARKSDLTGSVATVTAKDFNKGLVTSPEGLINGKVSGVQIMTNSGSVTGGSTIRIRGGASLNASNDPLIVLDGVPLEQGGISGNSSNFLALINPADIESMTVLKDASSTAIYGSRASNGVIIITTKKASEGKVKFSFNTTESFSTMTKTPDMLSASDFAGVIRRDGTAAQQALLGTDDTDWNDEVYHTGWGTDNSLSASGKIGIIPFRASVGYSQQSGLVRGDEMKRVTGNIVLSPSFFEDHLKVKVDAKGTYNRNSFYNGSAIWAAATFNPTIPVYADNGTLTWTDADGVSRTVKAFGGYNEAIDNTGNPVNAAVKNPRGLVDQYSSTSDVSRFIGSLNLDYKMHFLPELKAHVTAALDIARGQGDVYIPYEAASGYTTHGSDYSYGPQKNQNRLLTMYLNYNKVFDAIRSNLDLTAGYDYQYWKTTTPFYRSYNTLREELSTSAASDQRHSLISWYGRLNYSYDGRYLLTATVRRDGTSRFSKDNRWGTFPSVALGWVVTQEKFLKDNPVLTTLKLKASYGVTGQQDGIGNYAYLPVYTLSVGGSEALFGNTYYYTYRPEAYDSNLKWETTKSWDFGFDYGFWDNRITGSFDYYTRKTEDLLSTVPSAGGTNFAKSILTNVGNVDSHGVEFSVNVTPVRTDNWQWDLSFNATWQQMKVKNLSLFASNEVTSMGAGPWIDSYQFQTLTEDYAPYTFYLYHQLYDEKGKPIEGAYADISGDGKIDTDDLYHCHSISPDWILGFSTSLRWKQLTFGASFRANIGNYVYNGMAMNTGAWETVSYNSYQLNNLNASYLDTRFQKRQYLSDYWLENASFLKCDNINISYDFGEIWKKVRLNASVMCQNVFTVTKYSGTDPEVSNGMDNSFYPRPRTWSLSLGLQF